MLLRIPAPGPRSGASSPCPLLCDERVPPTRLGDFSSLPQLRRYPLAAAQGNDIISFTISPTPPWTLGPLAFGAGDGELFSPNGGLPLTLLSAPECGSLLSAGDGAGKPGSQDYWDSSGSLDYSDSADWRDCSGSWDSLDYSDSSDSSDSICCAGSRGSWGH